MLLNDWKTGGRRGGEGRSEKSGSLSEAYLIYLHSASGVLSQVAFAPPPHSFSVSTLEHQKEIADLDLETSTSKTITTARSMLWAQWQAMKTFPSTFFTSPLYALKFPGFPWDGARGGFL